MILTETNTDLTFRLLLCFTVNGSFVTAEVSTLVNDRV